MKKVKPAGRVKDDVFFLISVSLKSNAGPANLIYHILGGPEFMLKEPTSELQYLTASNKGLRKSALHSLSSILDIPMKDMASLLNISYKTLSRKRDIDLLDPLESSLSIELASLSAKGISLFESIEKFNHWLKRENHSLGGQTPLALLNTPTGIKLVTRTIERISEGIYS